MKRGRRFNPKNAKLKKLPKVREPLHSLKLECRCALVEIQYWIESRPYCPQRLAFNYTLPVLP